MTDRKSGSTKVFNVKNFVLGVICSVFIVCSAVTLTVAFKPLYYLDINFLDIPESSAIPAEVCRENYDVLINYNLLFSGEETLEFPDFSMSEEGRIHFEEVKDIFIAAQIITIAGIILFGIIIGLSLIKKIRISDFGWLRVTSCISAVLVCAVGIAVAIDWEWAFETMHSIFFRNDFWLFDYRTDPVINILPDEFFMHCGILIFVLIIIFVIIFEIIYRRQAGAEYGK